MGPGWHDSRVLGGDRLVHTFMQDVRPATPFWAEPAQIMQALPLDIVQAMCPIGTMAWQAGNTIPTMQQGPPVLHFPAVLPFPFPCPR